MPPGVGAGFERRDRRDIDLRRVIFQIVGEEGRQNFRRKYSPVSLENFSAPRELASSIS